MKICSISLIVEETQIKTMTRYHLTPIRMSTTKTKDKFGEDMKKLEPLSTTGAEKATAPHSITFAWKIPWMEEPGGLQSMGSHRVGHD